MHYCAIAPIGELQDTTENTVHMALAHLCDNEKYLEFFKEEKDSGKFLILDNSIIELGEALPVEALLAAAEKIEADEIIIPDVFRDSHETYRIAKLYVKEIQSKGYRVMAVAHGKNLLDWLWCAKNLILLGVDTLGIPKVMTDILGGTGRAQCLRELQKLCLKEQWTMPTLHLLGIWSEPLEVGAIQNSIVKGTLPYVRSCDSGIAYKLASYSMLFEDGARPEGPIDFIRGTCNQYVHVKNIMHCRQMCGDNMRLEFYAQDVLPPSVTVPDYSRTGNVVFLGKRDNA